MRTPLETIGTSRHRSLFINKFKTRSFITGMMFVLLQNVSVILRKWTWNLPFELDIDFWVNPI